LTTKSLTLWITAVSRFNCDAIGSELVSDSHSMALRFVTPAKAGVQVPRAMCRPLWVPAFAEMTNVVIGCGMPDRPA
jgi:hypothetical protein